VGPEVRERFLEVAAPAQRAATEGCFRPSPRRAGHFLADLQQLALLRLDDCGVTRTHRDTRCTYSLPARFFSHRREGVTGRMAALVLINPPA
jgi:copper oxidase (laccase) domain-containing protein